LEERKKFEKKQIKFAYVKSIPYICVVVKTEFFEIRLKY